MIVGSWQRIVLSVSLTSRSHSLGLGDRPTALAQCLQMPLDHCSHALFHVLGSRTGSDADRQRRYVAGEVGGPSVSIVGLADHNRVSQHVAFNRLAHRAHPAFLLMLAHVPASRSSLNLPATVTMLGLSGCLN